MSVINDFYKDLDIVNLFIFWGIIIVVILLLVFAIIISNKNKKLERIIRTNGINIDELDDNEIPTLKLEKSKVENTSQDKRTLSQKKETTNKVFWASQDEELPLLSDGCKNKIHEEKFVAEEYVISYNNKKAENKIDIINDEERMNEQAIIKPKPYQKNIFSETSHNQTSPIGITNNNLINDKEKTNAQELYNNLTDNGDKPINNTKQIVNNNYNDNSAFYNDNYQQKQIKENRLEKLASNNKKPKENLNRTEYELKQEEDAIISLEELMRKKDNIKTVDEEEAVISINELLKKKNEPEKLYNVNEIEDNNIFIDELKNFRSNLR